MKVLCLGAGYVGGSTMPVMAKHCVDDEIVVVDIDRHKVAAWNSETLPIFEPGLEEIVLATRGKNLRFSSDLSEITKADVIFIAINTGTKTYGIGAGEAYDLTAWDRAARSIAKYATEKRNYVIVEKSTVPVTTAEKVTEILTTCSQSDGTTFSVVSNPEFLAEGRAINDLEFPDRVLLGADSSDTGDAAGKLVASLYANWVPVENIITTNVYSAELSKLAANAMLAQRLSSVNALATICEATGANIREVSHVIGKDKRIGPQYLRESVGWGGSCFKKDISGLVYLCESLGLRQIADYWRSVIGINEYQKERFCRRVLKQMHGTVRGKKIAILGFAFKKDTGDYRESASIDICRFMLAENAKLHVYDPKVPEADILRLFPDGSDVKVEPNHHLAVGEAHAILVCTEWDEFKTYDYAELYSLMSKPAYVFDGRNILDLQKLEDIGFKTFGVGSRNSEESALPY